VIPDSKEIKPKQWPASRVFFVAAGGASLAASGALYGLSAVERSKFESAGTAADLDAHSAATNRYVIGSGVAGAAGVGMLGFGVLFFVVDGDPRPTLDIRF
jgi:hypothetical protein